MKRNIKKNQVEALEYIGNDDDVINFCGSNCYLGEDQVYVITGESDLEVINGDFIICDDRGQFHLCKHNTFVENYEKAPLTNGVERYTIRHTGGICEWLKEKLNIFKL